MHVVAGFATAIDVACATDKCTKNYQFFISITNRNKDYMGIITWIIFGGLAGWIGSMVMGTDGSQGIFLNIVVGIIGAILGGLVFSFFGAAGVTGFNFYSFAVAIIGSIIAIWLVQMIRGAR